MLRTAEILFNFLGAARRGRDGMDTYQLSISERDLYCTKCDLSDTRAEDSAVADGSGSAVTIIPIDPIDHKTKLHNDSEEAGRRAGQGRAEPEDEFYQKR